MYIYTIYINIYDICIYKYRGGGEGESKNSQFTKPFHTPLSKFVL